MITGDPLYPAGRLEYLLGICHQSPQNSDPTAKVEGSENPANVKYHAFWAHSHEDEFKSFNNFMKFLKDYLKKYPEAYIYHYNHYEPSALKRLCGRHGGQSWP